MKKYTPVPTDRPNPVNGPKKGAVLDLERRFKIAHLGNTNASRIALAAQLGIASATLQRYMVSDDMPLQLFIRMAKELNMTTAELLNPKEPIRSVQLTIFTDKQLKTV